MIETAPDSPTQERTARKWDADLPDRDVWLMRLSGWGVIAVVGVIAVIEGGSLPEVAWRVVPLVAFGIVFSTDDPPEGTRAQRHARIALESLLAFSAIAVGSGAAYLLMFLLSARAPFLLPAREVVPWVVGYAASVTLIDVAALGLRDGLLTAAAQSAGFAFFAAAAVALVRADAARRHSRELLAELREAHTALRAGADRAERLAVAEERNRMARDLHDTLGHRLTVAIVQLEGAERLIPDDPDRAAEIARTVRSQLRDGMHELRATVATLREPLDAERPLPVALRQLADQFEASTEIAVTVEVADVPEDLSTFQRRVLHLAAKEGLTNVQRHADAERTWIWAGVTGDVLELRVDDDGIGPDGSRAGFGRIGMAERVGQLGGTVELRGRPGGGARLLVRLPLTVPDAPGEPDPAPGRPRPARRSDGSTVARMPPGRRERAGS